MDFKRSEELYKNAKSLIPGGVNSPVRSFQAVGGIPRFIVRGSGSHIWDIDGNEYIDCVGSWGALIFGHADPQVVAAACAAAQKGTTFGAPTNCEVELAQKIIDLVPSAEKVRLVNSGTEAVMTAVRLARAYTSRIKVVKFVGGYHGHSDGLLARAGSGVAAVGLPDSAGVPESLARETLVLPYNDVAALQTVLHNQGGEIACVLVEPVAGNMGVVLPTAEFLHTLRQATAESKSLLIFDEVISGFRIGLGGAQQYFGLRPDLATLGKILGGGFPLAAVCGAADVMELLAPSGPVYQAGTLAGNPVACAAGLATLRQLEKTPPYDYLECLGARLEKGLKKAARQTGEKVQINRIGSMLTVFFADKPISDYSSARRSDKEKYAVFFHAMLERGVYLPPSPLEAVFLSAAHTPDEIDQVIKAAELSFKNLASH